MTNINITINKIRDCFNDFSADESGQGVTEYGAMMAFVALLVAMLFMVGQGVTTSVGNLFTAPVTQLESVVAYDPTGAGSGTSSSSSSNSSSSTSSGASSSSGSGTSASSGSGSNGNNGNGNKGNNGNGNGRGNGRGNGNAFGAGSGGGRWR